MRTLNRSRMVCLGAIVLLACAAVEAGVVYQADFEPSTYTLGLGIVGKGTPPWALFPGGADAMVVAAPGGGQCTEWVGDYSGGPTPTDVLVNFSGGIGTAKDLEIRQSCYYPSTNSKNRELLFEGSWGGTMIFGQGYFTGYPAAPVYHFRVSGGPTLASSPLAYDAWHEAIVVIHYGTPTPTIDFIVDSVPVAMAVPISGTGNMTFYEPWSEEYPTTRSGRILLDNVLMTQLDPIIVPEPSAIGLFGLAGLSLLARRRR